MAEQRVVLEHQPHAALAGGDVRDVAAVQRDAAMVDAGQPGDGAQQGALAAAAGPSSTKNSPSPMSSETSLTTGAPAYRLVT